MIGQATVYIRPLQQDLPLDCAHHASVPVTPCITCQKEVPFSEMKLHRLNCNGTPMQESEREQEGGRSEENEREAAPVSDSVTVRPDTSAESAVVPAMIDYELIKRLI
ncbi:hypothetical protein GJAV_G00274650 [Gymnothorax javanicus]|nr:hypothetical protein GJAV_G00274650 [Gymnothorax javanicus]